MNPKLAVARALVRNTAVAVPERRRQLNQLTADIRYEYDQQISQIRAEIAGMSAARVMWRAVVGFVARTPSGVSGAAAVAKLRVQLAEAHTAKFAALAELKLLKALS